MEYKTPQAKKKRGAERNQMKERKVMKIMRGQWGELVVVVQSVSRERESELAFFFFFFCAFAGLRCSAAFSSVQQPQAAISSSSL